MFNIYACRGGWSVYRAGGAQPVKTFRYLANAIQVITGIGAKFTIIIDGYQVA